MHQEHKEYFPTPHNPLNKNIFFTYVYNTFWGHSVLSYLQMVSFFFFFFHYSTTLSFPFSESLFQVHSLHCSLPHTQWFFFKYTDIFYLLLNKETFIFFKTEAMKQMGITVCENGKQFPEQKTKQNYMNK